MDYPSVAESLMLFSPAHSLGKDMLILTLKELCYLNVLNFVRKQTQSESFSDTSIYISKGEKYDDFEALPHQQFVMQQFNCENENPLLLTIINRMMKELKGFSTFKMAFIYPSLISRKYVSRFTLFNNYFLTHAGKEVKQRLLEELETTERGLKSQVQDDLNQALEALTNLRGNIFLIKSINLAYLIEIEQLCHEYKSQYDEPPDFEYDEPSPFEDDYIRYRKQDIL